MNINLYGVLSVVGRSETVEISSLEIQDVFQGEMLRISSAAPFTLTLKHVEKGLVTIQGDVTLDVIRSCGRCLSDVECEYKLSVNETVDVAKKLAYSEDYDDASEADEISYIEDCTLDVDRLILDELYTVIPMSVLCREDCKGICKVCGTNLNKSTCECDQTVPDPRMAVFGDIFNQFKEV